MKAFTDLGVFGAFLAAKVAEVNNAAQLGLRDAARMIQEDARGRIGTYQGGMGPFPAWEELADVTKEERVKLGWPENDPLLRSGEMRDAIEIGLERDHAVVGVPNRMVGDGTEANPTRDIGDIAADQELGTHRGIPPRPFLGPAGYAKGIEGVHAISQAVGDSIAGLRYRPYKQGSFKEEIPW